MSVVENIPDTPVEEVDDVITRVAAKAEEWKSLSVSKKLDLLKEVLANTIEVYDEWVATGFQARNIDPTNPQQGSGRADVRIGGPLIMGAYLNSIIVSYESWQNEGHAPTLSTVRPMGNSTKSSVRVYPYGWLQLLETVGLTGDVIINTKTPQQLQSLDDMAGGVAGILGAGNYDVPCDLLTQMFTEGRVCIYKPNPVAQATHSIVRKVLKPLTDLGYVDFLVGGKEVGGALIQHPQLDEVVLTGSVGTLKAIQPLIEAVPKSPPTKICAELGAVNPWIVVPGPEWSNSKVDVYARTLAWAKLSNNGHICASPQVLILPKSWPFRQHFSDRLRYWLAKSAGSAPFYPGSFATHQEFSQLESAEIVSSKENNNFEQQQHCVYLPNVDAHAQDDQVSKLVRTKEAFCPVLCEIPLDFDDDSMTFLKHAVEYAETHLHGSLTATLLVNDVTMKEHSKVFDEIVADMKFGVVGINIWPAFVFSLAPMVWGGSPVAKTSGEGFFGNVFHLEPSTIEKSVLRAPFFWLGRGLLSVLPPQHHELVYDRMAAYKLQPTLVSQTQFFSALFLNV